MLYMYKDKLMPISTEQLDPSCVCVGYLSAEEFERSYSDFGLTDNALRLFRDGNRYFRSKIDVYDDYSFGNLKIIEPDMKNNSEIQLAFFIKRNFMLLIDVKDDDKPAVANFESALKRFPPESVTLEKFIFAFIESLIDGDNKHLEDIEFEINRLEDMVMSDYDFSDFNQLLLDYKKKLLVLRNYYEQLIDISEELYENENNIFVEDNLRYFKLFTEKSERLRSNVSLLRESIVQLRETYQANLDIRLNNTMKVFTVVTSIFLPLSLIAGWYGMNFRFMPELSWRFGYPLVFILSAAVVIICLCYFKKKKLL
ncbi:MAG: hypothetical protein IJT03_06725 [Clostridia bacterium]|nr:hypothetical protein [Clostridia bacterium]